MTNYNDGNWHGWNGGECPVDYRSIVEGMYLCDGKPAPESPITDLAGHFDWNYEAENKLIAFRVVKEYHEPREFWLYRDSAAERFGVSRSKPTAFWGEVIHVREVIE